MEAIRLDLQYDNEQQMRGILSHAMRLLPPLAVLLAIIFSATSTKAQVVSGDILITEFFEEIYQINPNGGMPTDLLNSPSMEKVLGHHFEFFDANTAYIVSFDELIRFNLLTGTTTSVDDLTFNPLEITSDHEGSLIAVEPSEIFRINPNTGKETSVYTETFFGPTDAVVDLDGNIYITEFFDALGVISSGGGFTKIGNFSTNLFNHLDLGPDGMLYLSSTFGGKFYRVDPANGSGGELDSEVFTSIDDLQVDDAGDIIFTGQVDSKDGIFRFNPNTLQLTTIIDEDTVNDGFFNPLDIAIYTPDMFAAADYNHDGAVDDDDLGRFMSSFGLNALGDTDDDADTDGADFLTWQRQLSIPAAEALVGSAVPEPSSIVVLIVATILLTPVRSRR